jgi:AcrR family transcriptional regulator
MQCLTSVTSVTLLSVVEIGTAPGTTAARKGERTRAALVDAAIARFAADGFRKASLAEIANDAGVSPTAVYRYFPDKDALFEAAVNADADGLVSLARAGLTIDTGGSLPDMLGMLSQGLAQAVTNHPLIVRVLAGQDRVPVEQILRLPTLVALRTEVAQLLRIGQKAKIVRADLDPERAALGLETIVIDHLGYLLNAGARDAGARDERWEAVIGLLEAALLR